MLVDNLIWHIYRPRSSSGFVEIDPVYMLLDAGEASGCYYSGCIRADGNCKRVSTIGKIATELLCPALFGFFKEFGQ
jgi:hypothetical protein|tara:strand:+ start:9635 stop:9865 length:231 start_codon:yes stop_codon:yes gene_type:complete